MKSRQEEQTKAHLSKLFAETVQRDTLSHKYVKLIKFFESKNFILKNIKWAFTVVSVIHSMAQGLVIHSMAQGLVIHSMEQGLVIHSMGDSDSDMAEDADIMGVKI
jgi:hypothetical protein